MLAAHHGAVRIHFLGGANTVTGSQFLLETSQAKVLIDCGMFQGAPNDAIRNHVPLAYDAPAIDAMLLTHAHLDHCGLIPHVVAAGFRGAIHATAGTVELASLVLLDSAKLQEEFAARHDRFARKHPDRAAAEDADEETTLAAAMELDPEAALRAAAAPTVTDLNAPLYTTDDANAAIALFKAVAYEVEIAIAPGVHATFLDAGHILGSAIIRVRVSDGAGERVIVFSGDLGRPDTPIIRDPTRVADADYLLIESTYGGREHEPAAEAIRLLGEAVRETAAAKGVLLIPSFAIGRTQEVVFELDRLLAAHQIPHLPMYLDSPMAQKATDIYRRYPAYYDAETRALIAAHDPPLDYPGATVTASGKESAAIHRAPRPFLVIASNGMISGGRIVQHVKELIGDPGMTLLFVGYQGQGTLGAQLQAGAGTVRIDGQVLEVHCRIRSIDGFSAHADEPELLAWLGGFTTKPKTVFIVHGEPAAQAALQTKVAALGFQKKIPHWRETVELA